MSPDQETTRAQRCEVGNCPAPASCLIRWDAPHRDGLGGYCERHVELVARSPNATMVQD